MTISIILFALSIRFVIERSKSVFRASTVGVCGGKKVSSLSFSISGLFSGKGGEGSMSRNKGVLRSLYLQSNSLSLLSSALRLYLQNNFFSLLSFDSVIGRLTLLYLLHLHYYHHRYHQNYCYYYHHHRFYQLFFLACLV